MTPLNITVLGATGIVGSSITREAESHGHRVTAASRHPGPSDACTPLQVDASSPADLDTALADADAAVLTVKATPGAIDAHASMTANVLDAAHRHDVRLLVIGGAGPLKSPDAPNRLVLDDSRYVHEEWQEIAQASVLQLKECHRHEETDWVFLSPPAFLEHGERTGGYRRGTDTLLTDASGASRISVEDLAVAAVDELEDPGTERHFTVVQA